MLRGVRSMFGRKHGSPGESSGIEGSNQDQEDLLSPSSKSQQDRGPEVPETFDGDAKSNGSNSSTQKSKVEINVAEDNNNGHKEAAGPEMNEGPSESKTKSDVEVQKTPVREKRQSLKTLPASPAWIIPLEESADAPEKLAAAESWSASLSELVPEQIISKWEQSANSTPSKSRGERLENAVLARRARLEDLKERRSMHNNFVQGLSTRLIEAEEASLRQQKRALEGRLQQAETRREQELESRRERARQYAQTPPSQSMRNEELGLSSQKRLQAASQRREEILRDTAARAKLHVENAKGVAHDLNAHFADMAAEMDESMIDRHLLAAERRQANLKNIQDFAARQNNYARAVYETNNYINQQAAEILQYKLDAAAFRRSLQLEEVACRARQDSLNASFRTYCARRLNDATWLNRALKASSQQATAEMRRELQKESTVNRLREAELRRANVIATHQFIEGQRESTERNMHARLQAADARRTEQLTSRTHHIRERRDELKARKAQISAQQTREMRMQLRNKQEAAVQRRSLLLEQRRRACAEKNWKTKQRLLEAAAKHEDAAALEREQMEEALKAAAERREELQSPIFSKLNDLKARRAEETLLGRELDARDRLLRKEGYAEIRLAELLQTQLNKIFNQNEQVRRTQQRREWAAEAQKDFLASSVNARLRYADAKHAATIGKVQEKARQTNRKVAEAREKLREQEEQRRTSISSSLSEAALRRAQMLEEQNKAAKEDLRRVQSLLQAQAEERERRRQSTEQQLEAAAQRRLLAQEQMAAKNQQKAERIRDIESRFAQQSEMQLSEAEARVTEAASRHQAELKKRVDVAKSVGGRVELVRLTRRAEQVANNVIKTAMMNSVARQAEDRRKDHIEQVQMQAAVKGWHAKAVAEAQKELFQVQAEAKLEQSMNKLREGEKRREGLIDAKRHGESIMSRLQPFSDLQVIGQQVTPDSPSCA